MSNNTMPNIALIGDIQDSRSILDRSEIQDRMNRICEQLNTERPQKKIVSPFTITLGDEFQAVFSHPEFLWKSIFTFEADMHPIKLRYGIGIGTIDTKINTQAAIGMDGPAFHLARKAIEDLRKENKFYRIMGLKENDALVRNTLDLISEQRSSWNKNRLAIFSMLLNNIKTADMSEPLNISTQAVYKNIKEGQLETISNILKGINDVINSHLVSDL